MSRKRLFDQNYERYYEMTDEVGNKIRIAETEVVLDDQGRAARFRVSGNLQVIEDEIAFFTSRLYGALAVVGIGGLIVNGLAILFGLKPLDRARRALSASAAARPRGSRATFRARSSRWRTKSTR